MKLIILMGLVCFMIIVLVYSISNLIEGIENEE